MSTANQEAETGIVKVVVPKGIEIHDSAKEQIAKCEEFLNGIADLDTRMELWRTLQESLEQIGRIRDNYPSHPGKLYKDFAPLSFEWCAGNLQGGLIFHGEHDGFGNGGAPTFSVSLSNTRGWQLHT
jgi:hypothetical protein